MSDSSLTLSTVGTDSADSDTVAPSIRKKTNPVKTAAVVMLLCAIFGGLPALEDHFGRGTSAWEPKAAPRFPLALPPLFGLVVLVNIVGASLVLIFKLGFGIVITARKKYGYELPIMHASQDILQLDVEAGGALFSGGDAAAAQQRWTNARDYNCSQRAHHQPLETFSTWLLFSFLGGIMYPASTALYGFLGGIVGRIAWANGYASGGGAGARYRDVAAQFVWLSLVGLLVNTVLAAIAMLRGL